MLSNISFSKSATNFPVIRSRFAKGTKNRVKICKYADNVLRFGPLFFKKRAKTSKRSFVGQLVTSGNSRLSNVPHLFFVLEIHVLPFSLAHVPV